MGKLLALVLVLLAVVAIGGLLYRPGAVIGVSGKSLAHSIEGEAGAAEMGACIEGDDDHFNCTVLDAKRKVVATYSVETKDAGCWDATRKGEGGGSQPQTLSGCITIVDLLRLD